MWWLQGIKLALNIRFWGFSGQRDIIGAIGFSFVYASIAELGSMHVYLYSLCMPTDLLMGLPYLGFRPLVASISGLLF